MGPSDIAHFNSNSHTSLQWLWVEPDIIFNTKIDINIHNRMKRRIFCDGDVRGKQYRELCFQFQSLLNITHIFNSWGCVAEGVGSCNGEKFSISSSPDAAVGLWEEPGVPSKNKGEIQCPHRKDLGHLGWEWNPVPYLQFYTACQISWVN